MRYYWFLYFYCFRDSLDDPRLPRPHDYPSPPLVGSKFCPPELFGMHPDFSFIPPTSTPLFLPGRPQLDPYCHSTSITTNLYHSPYGCHPIPPPPLTMPVKFIVPPSRGGIISPPTKQICFDRSHADRYVTSEQQGKFYINNFSRIVSENSSKRRQNNGSIQSTFLNSTKRHASDIEDEHFRTKSPENVSGQGCNGEERLLTNRDYLSKVSYIEEMPECKMQCNSQNNGPVVHNCEDKMKTKLVSMKEQIPLTTRIGTIPLDLTKFK